MVKKNKYKHNNNSNVIIIIIIVVLLLISSCVGGYVYYDSTQKNKTTTPVTTVPTTTKPDLKSAIEGATAVGSEASAAGIAAAATLTTRPNIITTIPNTTRPNILSETTIRPTTTVAPKPTISPRCNRLRCNNKMLEYINLKRYFLDSTTWFPDCDFCPNRYFKIPNAIKIDELTENNIDLLTSGMAINDPARLPITSEQINNAYEFLKLPI